MPQRFLTVVVLLLIVVASPLLLTTLNEGSAESASATSVAQSATLAPLATAYGSPTPLPGYSSQLTLYDGAVAPGFNDSSFGFASRKPCDASLYYSPPCSYAIAYTAWGALNFQLASGTLNTSGYRSLQYKLNPNGQPIADFGVLLVSISGRTIKSAVLSSRNATTLPDGWLQISLAIARLNPSHLPVGGIQLKNELNKQLPVVHYDDVMLTGGTGNSNPFSTPVATASPVATPTSHPTLHPKASLPGQKIWPGGVSSFLFGSNDSEEWSPDNVETDPHRIIQSSMKAAHFTLARTFVFHYSLRDGHRTTIGTHPRIRLSPNHTHEYDRPSPPPGLYTGSGYEVEKRIRTIESTSAHCLVTLKDIWTTPAHNVDPNPFHKRIIDPATGKPETDLDFARKVVAYLGNRCNLYEIGNETDLDEYTENGVHIHHMDVKTYVQRWTEFVRALRKINPRAKFIGPVTYNDQGTDCTYTAGTPYPSSHPGDCYLQNFLHGVKGTNVEPDAVSFHWYPCSDATLASCAAEEWNSYARVTNEVRGWIRADLGHLVPVGITEWNFDPGANTALASDSTFMDQYTRAALSSMISAGLDFAAQFDTQSFGGYGALDMFDLGHNDQPKVQFDAVRDIIGRYRPSGSGRHSMGKNLYVPK
jgi:Glycoside hydrolase family 44